MVTATAPRQDDFAGFVAAFKLDRFGVGRHPRRDHRGWQVGEEWVDALWLAAIKPSFDPHAYLMVVHPAKSPPRALFCFCGAGGLPIIQGEAVECPGFDDQVSACLRRIDLAPPGGGISLDGISYSLRVRNWAVDADLSFSNPRQESLRLLERALFAAAESLARITGRQDMADYLRAWGRYLD